MTQKTMGDTPIGDLLIVDDKPANLRLLSAMLVEQGYKIRSVLNGPMALTAAQSAPPDLILLDIKMPDMDGYEVCQRLKDDERTRDIPILFISAQAELQDKVKGFTVGGVDYITKPFQIEEVLARVQTHLSLRNTQNQLQVANIELEMQLVEVARSNTELDMLRHVAQTLNQTVTLDEAARSGLETTVDWLDLNGGWLTLVDENGNTCLAASVNLSIDSHVLDDLEARYTRMDVSGRVPSGDFFEPIVVSADPDKIPVHIRIPLCIGKRRLGSLNLLVETGIELTEGRQRLFKTIGDQYSAAIERGRLFEHVQRLAITDPLTGVFNRRHFFTLAHQALEGAIRYSHPLSIIMMDIDHFKTVNDTYGHAVGDQVLEEVANLCQDGRRKADVIGRYGGEEFVILLPETDASQANLVAQRLCRRIAQAKLDTGDGPLSITVSLGVASQDLKHEIGIEELLNQADQALYCSKQSGRNQVSMWQG